jgi:hypothetical protein
MSYSIRRVDKNQPSIVRAFRASGFSVAITSSVSNGFPDLVVGINLGGLRGCYTTLVEIKDGSKPLSAQKLTPDEVRFREQWRGNYHIVRSEEDVANLLDMIMQGG